MNALKSVLYHKQKYWIEANNNNSSKLFDMTMGGKHGAEICELVGLYILDGAKSKIKEIKVGIYRDDRLIAIDKNTSGSDIIKIKKKMHEYANEIGNKIELENPAYEINYLDLNLNSVEHSTHAENQTTKSNILM